LLGYSLGGRLALHALTTKPENWEAAILLSPHPGLQSIAERAARLQQDKAWAARFLNDPWDQVMAEWNGQAVLAGTSASQPELEASGRQVAQAFDGWSLGRQQDLRPLLPSVKCPVLWITGELDEKFTALARACTLLPNGIHRTIPNAGHRVHLDQPSAVIDTVRAFLDASGM
jgi:2-succinyl-6-hydroxy-2,4-cyclohexadiene-1-carboxylate synthase